MHWQDLGACWLGSWLVVSPFVLNFAGVAAVFTVILGLGVILAAVEALYIPSFLEEWVESFLGVGLLIAPYLGEYVGTLAGNNSILFGIAVIVLAAWEMVTDHEFADWWREHMEHPTT
jgi:hypothetical protein